MSQRVLDVTTSTFKTMASTFYNQLLNLRPKQAEVTQEFPRQNLLQTTFTSLSQVIHHRATDIFFQRKCQNLMTKRLIKSNSTLKNINAT